MPATSKKPQGSAVSLLWNLSTLLLNLSKCQNSLEERNHLVKIPTTVRSLLSFWKDSHHKKISCSVMILENLIGSIQEETSKAAMSSGGILSKLRTELMESLPVLDIHADYLRSMSKRKQKESKAASSAVECVVQDIGERENITIIEIGEQEVNCKEVKDISDALSGKEYYEPVNISTVLPADRRRRYKVLNQYLVKESPQKVGLWTFDNHGAPQSVFIFLINLEDEANDIMQHVLDLRPQLLSQQSIFYPKEFSHQFKHFSSSIVDVGSAPMRILLNMILGNSRGSQTAATKVVEDRVVEAILGDDDELALDMRAFNGKESQYLSFLSVVRRTISEFLAEDKNRWQTSYDGSVLSNLSMSYSLPALFSLCVQNALKEDPTMPIPASDKYLCRYLYPRTTAAAAAVSSTESLLPLRWAVQQKIFDKPNPDSYFNMSMYKSLKTFAVALGNLLVMMVGTDDKTGIDVGDPDLPIVACQHPGKSWIPNNLKLGEGQHSFHKLNLTPSVRLVHHLPPEIDGSFYRGKPQLTLKDAVFEPSSGPRHFSELASSLLVNTEDKKPVTIITNDGGPDHNIHHARNKASLLAFFLRNPHILYLANFQMAANRSSFHPVEKVNCIINLALNGVALARENLEDANFDKILKSCSSMVDIRNRASENPGLVDQVSRSLNKSKDIIENRIKLASLKENPFEVFEASSREEVREFMNVLKTVDGAFDVDDFLDTKKKFHLTGPLLLYYEEVATETYYCITMTRHRNMSADFLNNLYPDLNLPFDLHPIPCPIKDKENPEKYLKFEDLYHSSSLRSYDDQQRPGKTEKKSHNIPFPKSIVRARYCCEIIINCVGCGKRRVVYSKYKTSPTKIAQARYLLENMRFECGSSLCSFGTEGLATVVETSADARSDADEAARSEVQVLGNESIFSLFFVDESLCCSSPVEKNLYEILLPSVTSSAPCFYCGETDLIRTTTDSDQTYPLCHYCRTVKKFGSVLKRKKRTIVPRQRKQKNKSRKKVDNDLSDFIDFGGEESEEEIEVTQDSDEEDNHVSQLEVDIEDEDESDGFSLPPSPNTYAPVEQLLDGSDSEN